jgi:NADPH-dependent 2,4-dienoyl-CoA reductase/sulfur reductase-like enzyme/nitrite reductase/ring-hydroxylating ferredoxin subunit
MAKTRVAKVGDILEGRMLEVQSGESNLILAKVTGTIHAFGSRCPHHDAPLVDGLLDGAVVLCPWHQSAFDITDGQLVAPPALECLPTYDVEIDGEDVLVDVPDDPATARQPTLTEEDRSVDRRVFVVVGAGAAGFAAAQELRRVGFQGRLLMISDEPNPPYDRTQLSKDFLSGEAPVEWLPLKPDSFETNAGIEHIHHRLDVIDLDSRRLDLPGGATIDADGLLLATGGEPRRPQVEGAALDGVVTLRTWSDCDDLIARAQAARRVAVVGAGFIGMEVAASLRQRGVERVTVIAREETPFEKALGSAVGGLFQRIHEEHGVEFELGREIQTFRGPQAVQAVRLDNGTSVEADLVIAGIGVRPATAAIKGVDLESDGSLLVDDRLRVRDGVFAAGDIATFPDWRTGEPTRIEHWRTAQQQGMIAGRNLAGANEPFRAVPFFWTVQFGVGLGYVGHAGTWDQEIEHGRVADRDFIRFYVKDGRVLAAAAMGRDRQLSALHQLISTGREPSGDRLQEGEIDLTDLLAASP